MSDRFFNINDNPENILSGINIINSSDLIDNDSFIESKLDEQNEVFEDFVAEDEFEAVDIFGGFIGHKICITDTIMYTDEHKEVSQTDSSMAESSSENEDVDIFEESDHPVDIFGGAIEETSNLVTKIHNDIISDNVSETRNNKLELAEFGEKNDTLEASDILNIQPFKSISSKSFFDEDEDIVYNQPFDARSKIVGGKSKTTTKLINNFLNVLSQIERRNAVSDFEVVSLPGIRAKDIKVLVDNPSLKNIKKLSTALFKAKLTRDDPFKNKSVNLINLMKNFEKEIKYATRTIKQA